MRPAEAALASDAAWASDAARPSDAPPAEPPRQAAGWRAHLDLGFEARAAGTVLVRNRHSGPLLVQKSLHPEGPGTCHVVLLHPPGGIAAGDRLRIDTTLEERARVLLTTPGATKWYRSEGEVAHQALQCRVGAQAVLEWLPREQILFNGSNVATTLDVTLAADAGYLGWEMTGFGRRASGERWSRGRLRTRTAIRRCGRLLWSEVADVDADGGFAQSSVGLSGFTVCGTLVVAGYEIGKELLGECRQVRPDSKGARRGITRLPSVLIARYLGDCTEEGLAWFAALWSLLRPVLTGRTACPPRIWAC